MLPLRIIIDQDAVTAVLREGKAWRTLRSEAIIDVNHDSRWIRGIEFVGGIDFNLERALKPFGQSSGVRYDPEANAAFIDFAIKSDTPLKHSHSLTPDAELAFDEHSGLLWVKFSPSEENNDSTDFVSLIDTKITVTE